MSIESVSFNHLSFTWPDGTSPFTDLQGTLPTGKIGLIGDNGSGKSTLLKLISGGLTPSGGRLQVSGVVGYLPQTLPLHEDSSVAELLRIETPLAALRAIESGSVDPGHFDAIGNDWDIEARAQAALGDIGLAGLGLERRIGDLSGGEAMLVAITGVLLGNPRIVLLDEPTNNLDRPTRGLLHRLIENWNGTLVIVSHDVELLERMDYTAELHRGGLRLFGGPYSHYLQRIETEQSAARQSERAARQSLKTEKRQRQEAETKLARRARAGRAVQTSGSIPRIVAGNLARKAQESAGSMRSTMDGKVAEARAQLDEAGRRVREDEHIRLQLPDPDVPRGRKIAQFSVGERALVVQGPERLGLTGPNGSGKTTLLRALLNGAAHPAQPQLFTDRVGYLPQRLAGLSEFDSALDNVRSVAPQATPDSIRSLLARMLLRGDTVDRPLSTLSGGERFRVYLAALLLADPAPQLLILDEPTNNVDISSVRQLAEALDAYQGALLVVSHDEAFLERLGLDARLKVDGGGVLSRRAVGG